VDFEVESIVEPNLRMQDRGGVIALGKEMGLFANRNNAASRRLSERSGQIDELIETLKTHPRGTPELLSDAMKLKHRLEAFDRKLSGDRAKSSRWVMAEPGISQRLQRAFYGTIGGTHGPTKTTLEQYEIAKEQWSEIEDDLYGLLGDEIEAFEKAVDDAGIPWTSGRDLP
ncbi:MAG: hypothetical protein AAGJ83_10205, partial [Planctomycetota bacterium]